MKKLSFVIKKELIDNSIKYAQRLNDYATIPLIKFVSSDIPCFWCYGNYISQFDETVQNDLRKVEWNNEKEDCFIDFGDNENAKKSIVNYSKDKPFYFNLYRFEIVVIKNYLDESKGGMYVPDPKKLDDRVKSYLREIVIDYPYAEDKDDRREDLLKKNDPSNNLYSFLEFHFGYFDGYREDFVNHVIELTNEVWSARLKDNQFRKEILNEWIEEKVEEYNLDRSKINVQTQSTVEPFQTLENSISENETINEILSDEETYKSFVQNKNYDHDYAFENSHLNGTSLCCEHGSFWVYNNLADIKEIENQYFKVEFCIGIEEEEFDGEAYIEDDKFVDLVNSFYQKLGKGVSFHFWEYKSRFAFDILWCEFKEPFTDKEGNTLCKIVPCNSFLNHSPKGISHEIEIYLSVFSHPEDIGHFFQYHFLRYSGDTHDFLINAINITTILWKNTLADIERKKEFKNWVKSVINYLEINNPQILIKIFEEKYLVDNNLEQFRMFVERVNTFFDSPSITSTPEPPQFVEDFEIPNQLVTIRWNANKNVLTNIFVQLKQMNGKDGKPIIENSYEDIAVFLKSNFDCYKDTEISTITTTLKSQSGGNNKPHSKKIIEIRKSDL